MSVRVVQRVMVLAVLALLPLLPAAVHAGTEALAPGIQAFNAYRYEAARVFFEPYAKRNPKDAEAAFYLGKTYLALRQYEPAIDWLAKASALAPRSPETLEVLGRAYTQAAQGASLFSKPGLVKKARESWERAVALDPNDLDGRADLVEYFLQAPGFLGGSVDKAREQAAEIQKRDAVRGALAYSKIELDQKDFNAAEKVLEQGLQKAPSGPGLRLALASVYQSQKRWDAAFAELETILKADPNDWDALYQLGKTGALSGQRLDRGEECLRRYLGHTPGPESVPLANAHLRLGTIFEKRHDKAAARAEYQAALKLDPQLEDAKRALASLG